MLYVLQCTHHVMFFTSDARHTQVYQTLAYFNASDGNTSQFDNPTQVSIFAQCVQRGFTRHREAVPTFSAPIALRTFPKLVHPLRSATPCSLTSQLEQGCSRLVP